MTKLKAKARIAIKACKFSGKIFPHSLLYGIGGLGKTALARAISNELGYYFIEILGSSFSKPKDITEALLRYSKEAKSSRRPLFLFIDEVHQLRVSLQESLYVPMKEWRVNTLEGFRSLSPFTLIVATTRFDMLDANSFVTRFPNVWEVTRYSESDIALIVAHIFREKGFLFSSDVTKAIASRSLGVPRNAMSLVEKVELTVLSEGRTEISLDHVEQTFMLEELDYLGLSPVHLRYMQILSSSRGSDGNYCPIGVGAIAAKMRQNERVIEGSIEPILLERSFVAPTARGRKITKLGTEYLRKILVEKS